MKFKLNIPRKGDIKVRTCYNIFPRVINGDFVWLERTKNTYIFKGYMNLNQSPLDYFFSILFGWEAYKVDFIERSKGNGNSTNG